jgi:DNA-binding CsgD family transcriptional regulator
MTLVTTRRPRHNARMVSGGDWSGRASSRAAPARGAVPALLGRRDERGALDRIVAGIQASQGQVLVLRGDAGVGKTALLEYLVGSASRCRVERAAGVESEMELAFAGLHQLCGPLLDRLERLPAPQRDALRVAFGLTTGERPDRFRVGLAVLSLLADAAEDDPLICVVDDAQWLDRVSAQTLAFVARRLLAERVALVFAVRESSGGDELAGLPELVVTGLDDADAGALLASALRAPIDTRVRDRIVAETRGNPLALLELPRGMTAAELAGGFGLPDSTPLASRIEDGFLRRLQPLPIATRRLLLVAAAEPLGDVILLWRAAERLGISPDAAAPAEAEGLLEIGTRVRFRHPLVRSAAYRSASLLERQEVHRALAQVTDQDLDPDRHAWHRAHAAVQRDEVVASELERSAVRAQARGGIAAAAAFLARATELTPDRTHRGARALAAASAKFEAAATDSASELLLAAELCPLDEVQRAKLERLRAQLTFARRRGSDTPSLLLDAARRLEPLDPPLARQTYLDAFGAAIFAGRLGSANSVSHVAQAARSAAPISGPPRSIDLLLDGLATRFRDGYVAGVAPLRQALAAFELDDDRDERRWSWYRENACHVARELWDDAAWHRLATDAVRLARQDGALTVLPFALTYAAGVALHAGELARGSAMVEEAAAITQAAGNAPLRYTSLLLAAWRGAEAPAVELIDAALASAKTRGEGRAVAMAQYTRALLYNGLGRHEEALTAARQVCEYDDLGLFGWALLEAVEAAVRCDNLDLAADAVGQLAEQTRASGTDWGLGVEAWARALLSESKDAEAHYLEAIERLERTQITVHLARARLAYGEWLRRANRAADARAQLHIAHDVFTKIGAEGFAERASRELVATGERAHTLSPERREALSAQEEQIARLAADGHTNPEIGAQLFISPRTVEWHLRKVYPKLGISTRKELRGALPPLREARERPPLEPRG